MRRFDWIFCARWSVILSFLWKVFDLNMTFCLLEIKELSSLVSFRLNYRQCQERKSQNVIGDYFPALHLIET